LTGITVTGDSVDLDIEWADASAAIEAVCAVRLDTSNNSKVKLKYSGFTAGNALVDAIRLDDCDNVDIIIDGFGLVATAWVDMIDAASTNVTVNGILYTQGITNFSRDVVNTVGGGSWSAEIFDASAGANISGGSASALASDDVSAVKTVVDAIQVDVGNPSARTNLQSLEAMLGNPDTASKTIYAEIKKIDSATLESAPVAGSVGRFIASGGTALGTQLPDSKSLYDMVRQYGEGYLVSKAYADLTGYDTAAAFTVTVM